MEIELKLELAPADAEKLLGGRSFRNAVSEDLTSVHFYTPTWQLRDAGFSLRVRHAGARMHVVVQRDPRRGDFARCAVLFYRSGGYRTCPSIPA